MSALSPPRSRDLNWNADGLIPGVVQDTRTGQVLMVAYLNRESYAKTLESGYAHFWSRSRQELWFKGATSGATLKVVTIAADCDADTLLIGARPAGPGLSPPHTPHLLRRLPTGRGIPMVGATVGCDRIPGRGSRPSGSYTTRLLEGGVDLAGRKLMEEATEVLMAARDHARGEADNRRVAEEMADLLYHLLVLAADREVRPAEMIAVLEERFSS